MEAVAEMLESGYPVQKTSETVVLQRRGVLSPVTTLMFGTQRLTGRPLLLARLLWLALAALMTVFYLVALPARFNEFHTVYPEKAPTIWQLGRADSQALSQIGLTPDVYAVFETGFALAFMLGFVGMAGLIFARRSDESIAILISLNLVTYGVVNYFVLDALGGVNPAWHLPINLVNGISLAIIMLSLAVYPDGRLYPRWIGPVALIWVAWMLIWPFFPDSVLDPLIWPRQFFIALAGGVVSLGGLVQVARYMRLESRAARDRTKWIIFGLGCGIGGYIISQTPPYLFPILREPGLAHILYAMISTFVFTLTGLLIPITFGISILRYRLFNIDLIINRGLVYGLLTALLTLPFFAFVVVLNGLATAWLGKDESALTIVIGALLVGTLFQPTRSRLQRLVDRLLYAPQAPTTSEAPTVIRFDAVGQMRFGPYAVLAPLGAGGMARVYKARHNTLNRLVAIKVLEPALIEQPNFRERFTIEAQTVATLKHPNIVQMFDFGHIDNLYYMAMEFIDGDDLALYIAAFAPVPLATALPILQDIASALDYAHQQGIVHRDVKPSNVMLQPISQAGGESKFRAVLMDFGIAKVLDRHSDLTQAGTVGTIDYIAPEQILDASKVDQRADIYALGLIAYMLLTGERPYNADTIAEKIYVTLQTPPRDPREYVPTLSDKAVSTLYRALAKSPEERYTHVTEFIQNLSTG
jgi:tRNA A-37 threonylcarbamoyl transferase component Bud32